MSPTPILHRTALLTTGRWAVLAVMVALTLALAEPPSTAWPLAGFALAPWLVVSAESRFPGVLVGSAFVGTAWGCASAPWAPSALRNLDAGPIAAITGWVVGAFWVKGIPFAIVGALVCAARNRSPALRIVATGFGFFAADQAHSTLACGVPWALLGHSQWGVLGVVQLAAVGGVPLLSGALAAINQAVAIAWEERGARASLRWLAALVAAWAALALGGLPLAKFLRAGIGGASGSEISLRIVQPNIPRGERWAENLQASHLSKVVAATARVFVDEPQHAAVLWPENLLTSPIDLTPELATQLQESVDRLDVPVILGAVRSASRPDLYRSSILWLAPRRGVVAELDKTRAFPLVEARRNSLGASVVAWAFGAASDGKKVEEATRSGPLQGDFTIAAVLCYEALFPWLVAERRDPETVAIVNLADDGWIGEEGATRQLAAFASFRAIEQRLPFVRVAHGGLSLAVDAFGESVLELPRGGWEHGRVAVQGAPPPGLAERLGLLALPLAIGLGVWWALGRWSRHESKRGAVPAAPHHRSSSP